MQSYAVLSYLTQLGLITMLITMLHSTEMNISTQVRTSIKHMISVKYCRTHLRAILQANPADPRQHRFNSHCLREKAGPRSRLSSLFGCKLLTADPRQDHLPLQCEDQATTAINLVRLVCAILDLLYTMCGVLAYTWMSKILLIITNLIWSSAPV